MHHACKQILCAVTSLLLVYCWFLVFFLALSSCKMPASTIQVSPQVHRHDLYTLTDSSECGSEKEEEEDPSKRLTPLEKLTLEMCKDENTIKELTVGRRVGFYKVHGQIGCGNFSKVKLAIHTLTKGMRFFIIKVVVNKHFDFLNLGCNRSELRK